jgi:peptidoglycan/LPS O-acetylase OafA/YrhL
MVGYLKENFKRKVSGSYYPGIDSLRFVSIFFVLLAHFTTSFYSSFNLSHDLYYSLLENGSNGVRIFFGISGFVIFSALSRMKVNKITYFDFIRKRFWRLEPSYIFIVSAIYIYIYITQGMSILDLQHMIFGFLYMHGIVFGEPLKYFEIAWSLEIEFWFYILAPIFAYFTNTMSRQKKNLAILFLIILGLGSNYFLERNTTNIIYYIHFFAAGMFLENNKVFFKSIIERMLFENTEYLKIIFFLILICALFFIDLRGHSLIWNFLGTILLIFLLCLAISLKNCSLPNWSITIGVFSYSIYLCHHPILVVSRFFVQNKIDGHYGIIFYSILFIITIASSALFFLFFERILIKWMTNK